MFVDLLLQFSIARTYQILYRSSAEYYTSLDTFSHERLGVRCRATRRTLSLQNEIPDVPRGYVVGTFRAWLMRRRVRAFVTSEGRNCARSRGSFPATWCLAEVRCVTCALGTLHAKTHSVGEKTSFHL